VHPNSKGVEPRPIGFRYERFLNRGNFAASKSAADSLGRVGLSGQPGSPQHTLPLFLSMSLENSESIAQLAATIQCDLDELRDALSAVQTDRIELMRFLNRASQDSQ
jgi:hypothetical protein